MYVQQGHTYIGGASVPFFVSNSMIKSGAQSKGFDQVGVYARKSYGGHLPPVPPGSNNDWDTIVLGRRAAPDGYVDVPPGVRWVVDTTPVQAPVVMPPAPVPAPTPAPSPPILANPTWDWPAPVPLPPSKPPATGPAAIGDMSGDTRMQLLVGAGVIGGAFFAWQAYQHFFKEGLSSHERKNILLYAGTVLALWGASTLVDVDEAWWLTPQGAAHKAAEKAAEALR